MIDHISVFVEDLNKSKSFYDSILSSLSYRKIMNVPQCFSNGTRYLGWVDSSNLEFYINEGTKTKPNLHIAFSAQNKNQVEEFYKSGLATGGRCNGKPGYRRQYHENYFSAFLIDPDGHNIEAVCHN